MIDLKGVKERLVLQLEATTEIIRATEMPTSIECHAMTAADIRNQESVKQPTKGRESYLLDRG